MPPLFKSKSPKAFSHNVKEEMKSGKPQDQSLAIAYSIKRKSKMAKGGKVMQPKRDDHRYDDEMMDEERPSSIAHAIMRKRQEEKMMAEGGMVDLDENSEEMQPNDYNEQNEDAAKKELYDLDQLDSDPMDSNEHGDELADADEHDRVDRIRARIKMRRGF